MLTAPSLLRLMRLASPALPVGGFSYSEGLEAAVEAGAPTGETATAAWLLDQLHLGLARGDLGVVGDAIDAWQRDDEATLIELNHWISTTRECAEARLQTEQMGRSMLEWLKHHRAAAAPALDDGRTGRIVEADDHERRRARRLALLQSLTPAPTWPIAFALAAAETGAPRHDALVAFAFAWAEAMVQAALKAVPLGQNAGQRVLDALIDAIPAAVEAAVARPAAERQAFMPMLAIHAARHETQYSRLFRS